MTQVTINSGLTAFYNYLASLSSGFTIPTIDGVPFGNYLGKSTGSATPLQLSTTQIVIEFPQTPSNDYLIVEGSGLSLPLSDLDGPVNLSDVGGTVTSAMLYSGGSFANGVLTGGVQLGSLSFTSSQYTLTAGDVSMTINGTDLPTDAGVVQSIVSGTYSGAAISLSQIQISEPGQTLTVALSSTALDITLGDYRIALSGSFPTSLSATEINDLIAGASIGAGGDVTGMSVTQVSTNTVVESVTNSVNGGIPLSSLGLNLGSLGGSGAANVINTLLFSAGGGVETTNVATVTAEGVQIGYQQLSGAFLSAGQFPIIGDGGSEYVESGGVASGTVVLAGGADYVSSGGVAKGDTVLGGSGYGNQFVFSGGVISGGTFEEGGSVFLYSGSVAQAVTFQAGAYIELPNLLVTSAAVNGSDQLVLANGGGAVYSIGLAGNVSNLDFLVANLGGSGVGEGVVSVGTTQTVSAGVTSSGVVAGIGEFILVDSGGVDIAAAVNGGIEDVYGHGVASRATIADGGSELISGGGVAIGTIVDFNSYESVSSGGVASATVVSYGGDEAVASGGSAAGAVVDYDGLLMVYAGGAASYTVVSSGGYEMIGAGGSLSGSILESGGTLVLSSGGSASGLTLEGGAIIDLAGVAATSASFNGARQLVVTDNGSVVDTLNLAALAGDLAFNLESDGQGGTDIVVGSAPDDNFNLAGKSDILIENTNGAVDIGELGGNAKFAYVKVAGLGAEWSFVGTGDFLGDGSEQFLIENTAGTVDAGQVVGGHASYTRLAGLGPEWSFVGSGDYLGSGDDQFLIENTAGAVDVGAYAAGHIQYTKVAGLGPEWKFVGSGDYLGDGKTDFLIESTTGRVVVGEVVNGHAAYTTVAGLGAEWKIVGTGDFLGDGNDQFLIENAVGTVDVAEVVAGHAHYTTVATLSSAWSFVGAGDYSGTGAESFLIENANGAVDTGTVVGNAAQFAQVTGLGSEWKFHG